jgi:hypothetical protein
MAALRKLVWIEHDRFRGWGCSECAWVFNSSGAPTGKSINEAMRNFEVQRDKEFRSHVCADHPRAKSQSTKRDVKQDWERLYRAAIIESDGSRTQKRLACPTLPSPHTHGTSNRAANWMTSNDGKPASETRSRKDEINAYQTIK